MKAVTRLNRYTTIPILLDMLTQKKLVLLDPKKWDDKNDAEILLEYKNRKRIKNLLALCFSHGNETIHHWKTYADGISGCCVEFNAKKLIGTLNEISNIRYSSIKYKKINDLADGSIDVNSIPFTKRWPYRCEEEFRIIWEGNSNNSNFEIDFNLNIINKITISQHMPEHIYSTIRDHLISVCKTLDQKINLSTIYLNKIWVNKFKKA